MTSSIATSTADNPISNTVPLGGASTCQQAFDTALSGMSQASWHMTHPNDGVMLSERVCAMSKHLNLRSNQVAQDHASHGHITHIVVPGETEMLRLRPIRALLSMTSSL